MLDDDTLLAGLLGIGAISVRRYARGERQCLWNTSLVSAAPQRAQRPGPASAPELRWDPDDATVQPIMALARSASLGLVAS